MFDPMQMGLLGLMGAQNPDMFAQLMSAQGISPTQVPGTMLNAPQAPQLGGLLSGLSGLAQNLPGAQPQGGLPTPMSPEQAAAAQGGAPAAAPGVDMMAALGKVKAPEQVRPVFSGGVSGSQGAPQARAAGGLSQGSEAILAALLGGGRGAADIPSLGSLLRGIG